MLHPIGQLCILDGKAGTDIGVPNSDPKTPPLEMVNVPPDISSISSLLSRAYEGTVSSDVYDADTS